MNRTKLIYIVGAPGTGKPLLAEAIERDIVGDSYNTFTVNDATLEMILSAIREPADVIIFTMTEIPEGAPTPSTVIRIEGRNPFDL